MPGYVDTDVYWRPDLRAGDTFAGPAVVEEFGSTVPVHPGFAVRVDAFGNLVVTKECAVNSAGLPTAYEHGNRLTPEGSTVDPILVEIVAGHPGERRDGGRDRHRPHLALPR